VLAVWSLLAVIVAVRQGLDISTGGVALFSRLPLIQVAIGLVQTFEQELVRRFEANLSWDKITRFISS